MPARLSRTRAVALVGGASAALVLAAVGPAAAATPKPKPVGLIGIDAAFDALPKANKLPGGVRLMFKTETIGVGSTQPCPEASDEAAQLFLNGSQASALYVPGNDASLQGATVWTFTATVFHTAALARAAMTTVGAAEKSCPKVEADPDPNDDGSDGFVPTVRASSIAYSVRGWKAYRTVDTQSVPDLMDDASGARVTTVYLAKGNVLLSFTEIGEITPGSAYRQDTWRKQATAQVVASFDALG